MKLPLFLLSFFALIFLLNAASVLPCERLLFLPMPKQISCNQTAIQLPSIIEDPCRILYVINSSKQIDHASQLIRDQQKKTFQCGISNIITSQSFVESSNMGFSYTVFISSENWDLKSAFKKSDQSYKIKIDKSRSQIKSTTYVGFVHGLQTFLQSVQCPKLKYKKCEMKGLPIQIQDQPAFIYRGLMVDTSRHFLPIHLLYETIDALMYNKMSVFHWHIVDEDAFPLILQSHPEIAKYGAFSDEQTYTSQQARDLVKYAMVRGIRIIPELDTPGHAASWGRAPQNKEKACNFGVGYMGPLDVTLSATYQLVKEVFAEIIDIFPDPIIHLGGDEVVLTCLKNKTQFVKAQGIQESELQRHYRRKQHKIIKELDSSKIPMYWMNGNINIEEGDIVHWWGGGNARTTNPVVISNYGPFYLDMGVGNYFGVSYGSYVTWLDLHNQNIDRMVQSDPNKDNILGAEICLWSEINNRYTHHMKIWIRGSSLAERTWNTKDFPGKPDFFRRITAHERLMNRRGIPTAPATCQQCETHPQFC